PKAAPGNFVQLCLGESALPVPLRRSRRKFLGQYSCYRKSLLIGRYAVGPWPAIGLDRSVVGRQWSNDGGRHTRVWSISTVSVGNSSQKGYFLRVFPGFTTRNNEYQVAWCSTEYRYRNPRGTD